MYRIKSWFSDRHYMFLKWTRGKDVGEMDDEAKFKVGDRVRITWGVKSGWEAVVEGMDHTRTIFDVRLPNTLAPITYPAEQLELAALPAADIRDTSSWELLATALEAHQALWEEHCNTVIGSERYLQLDTELENASEKVIRAAWQLIHTWNATTKQTPTSDR